MDDERLKRGTYLTEKNFDEQLERIREIWQVNVLSKNHGYLNDRNRLRQKFSDYKEILRNSTG